MEESKEASRDQARPFKDPAHRFWSFVFFCLSCSFLVCWCLVGAIWQLLSRTASLVVHYYSFVYRGIQICRNIRQSAVNAVFTFSHVYGATLQLCRTIRESAMNAVFMCFSLVYFVTCWACRKIIQSLKFCVGRQIEKYLCPLESNAIRKLLMLLGRKVSLEVTKHFQVQSLVVGKLETNVKLQFEIQNPSIDVSTCPVIAFYSPITCLASLEKCFHHTTGFQSNLRQYVGPLKPMGFQFELKDSLDTKLMTICATGWPDTSAGNILSPPYATDIDQLMLLLSFVLCLMADCLVIVVKQLDRAQKHSLTHLLHRKRYLPKWIVVFHDLEDKEEFEVDLLWTIAPPKL